MNDLLEIAKWHEHQAKLSKEMRKAVKNRYVLVEPLTPVLDEEIATHERFAEICRDADRKLK